MKSLAHDEISYEPIRLYSFWFCVRLRTSRLPLGLVAVERSRRVRRLVGLALILALLVVDDLGTLAATREHHRGHRAAGDHAVVGETRHHDLPPVGAGAGGGIAPGGLGASGRP